MSSILDSAPTLITNTYDDKGQILLRETAIPITAKTAEQKANLKALGTGYYLQHSPQQRRVDSVMLDLLEKDDRELGAQCRNSHMDGLKNAYLSHTVVYDALAKSIRAESCEVRCATIVYVGKGGTKEEKITAAARNLEQIDWALNNQSNLKSYKEIPRTHLHLSILNTNLPLGHQDEMVKYSAAACTLVDRASFSYTPTNVLGMIDFLKIDTMLTPEVFSPPRDTFLNDLKQCFIDKPETRVSWSHANRVFRAAAVSFIAGHITGRLAITACASGQDRTGTLSAIKAIFMLMEADNVRFSGFESFKREFDIYAEKYVAGKHQAILASLLVAGSPGLKSDSCIAGVLPEKLEESHYWRAAKSNKEAPLGDAGLSMIAEYAKFHHPAHILMAKDKDSSEPHSGAGAGM